MTTRQAEAAFRAEWVKGLVFKEFETGATIKVRRHKPKPTGERIKPAINVLRGEGDYRRTVEKHRAIVDRMGRRIDAGNEAMSGEPINWDAEQALADASNDGETKGEVRAFKANHAKPRQVEPWTTERREAKSDSEALAQLTELMLQRHLA